MRRRDRSPKFSPLGGGNLGHASAQSYSWRTFCVEAGPRNRAPKSPLPRPARARGAGRLLGAPKDGARLPGRPACGGVPSAPPFRTSETS